MESDMVIEGRKAQGELAASDDEREGLLSAHSDWPKRRNHGPGPSGRLRAPSACHQRSSLAEAIFFLSLLKDLRNSESEQGRWI